MAIVQMQRVRPCAGGAEVVTFAQNLDLRDNAEYLAAERELRDECAGLEFVRTVGDASPLWVETYHPVDATVDATDEWGEQ